VPKRCYRTAPCKELSIHRGSTFGFGSHFLARQRARPIGVGDEYPSAVRALRMGAKRPRLAASPMSPPIRSATLPSPTWPIALGSIAGCATSAPASPPSGGERCTWRGLRPLQGVLGRRWWPTTSCRWPASNRDRASPAPQPCNGDHLYPARLPVHVNRVLSRELLRQREMPSRNIQPTRLQPSIVLKNRSTQKQEYSKTGVYGRALD